MAEWAPTLRGRNRRVNAKNIDEILLLEAASELLAWPKLNKTTENIKAIIRTALVSGIL